MALGSLEAAFAALERTRGMPPDEAELKPLARDPRHLALGRRRLDAERCARKLRTLEALPAIPPPVLTR